MSQFYILYITLHGEPFDDYLSGEPIAPDPQSRITVTTLSLAQALQAATLDNYSLILVDGVAGSFTLAGACRQVRAKFRKPLLVLMANRADEVDEAAFVTLYALGVDECIVRPKNRALLAAKIRSWLRWSIALYGIPRKGTTEHDTTEHDTTVASHEVAPHEHDPAHRRS